METTTITGRIRKEQLATIKELEINFSEWLRDKIDEELITPKEIHLVVKKTKKKLQKLLKIEQNVTQITHQLFKGSSKEKEHLKITREILQKRPELMDGRINLYINEFFKQKRPTRKQFVELLENFDKND